MILNSTETEHAKIDAVSGAAATVVTGVPGKRIVVVFYVLSMDAAGEYNFQSDATALGGAMDLSADTPSGGSSSFGVLATAAGEDLKLLATQAANGHLTYILVDG